MVKQTALYDGFKPVVVKTHARVSTIVHETLSATRNSIRELATKRDKKYIKDHTLTLPSKNKNDNLHFCNITQLGT